MYSKNPVTEKLDTLAYKSDVSKLITRVAQLKTDGGDDEVEALVNQANSITASATIANTTAQANITEASQYIDGPDGVNADFQAITTIKEGFNKRVSGIKATDQIISDATELKNRAFNEIDPQNQLNAERINKLLDCFVDTTERIADLDTLQEVGTMAFTINGDKYQASHCKNKTELDATTFAFHPQMERETSDGTDTVVSNNLMSLSDLSGINASIVKKWNGISLPSLVDNTGNSSIFGPELTTYYGELPNLVMGENLFNGCNSLTGFYTERPKEGETVGSGVLPNLLDGNLMFCYCNQLNNWTVEMPKLTSAETMFAQCRGLSSWTTPLPNLENGRDMFSYTGLTEWNIDLPNLKNGVGMFYECSNLASWSGSLKNLTDGSSMFGDTNIDEWTTPLPSLVNGHCMFASGPLLTSCAIPLPNLKTGNGMFQYCTLFENGPT